MPDVQWSKGNIVWLPKSGDLKDTGKHRGITLHSVVGKMYTAYCDLRLRKLLEGHVDGVKRISTQQNGFRSGEARSCPEHILSLAEVLHKNKEEGHNSYLFFQGFSKAFDLVDHDLLNYKLYKVGVTGKLPKVIMRRYKRLSSCCTANGKKSSFFEVEVGTAQGCPMSPALFNIFVQDLVEKLKAEGNCDITFAYAADMVVVVYVGSPKPPKNCTLIFWDLRAHNFLPAPQISRHF